jgi:hypothetical protein
MVYQNNFVATVKVGNKILRENQNTVIVPFGSEYSIYLKNLSTVRALVRVSVDGKDATEGVWLIVNANSPLELERYIKNGNMSRGNRFKFIERTGAVEEHRGVGAEDGLIRVEYKFEKLVQPTVWPNQYITWISSNGSGVTYGGQNNLQGGQFNVGSNVNYTQTTTTGSLDGEFTKSSSPFRSAEAKGPAAPRPSFSGATKGATRGVRGASLNRMTRSAAPVAERNIAPTAMNFMSETMCDSFEEPTNDAGITVAGSESNQKFTHGAWFPTEDASHTLILKLVGKVGEKPVVEAITVQHKPVCTSCGKVNKATFKFCGRCGTSLVLL